MLYEVKQIWITQTSKLSHFSTTHVSGEVWLEPGKKLRKDVREVSLPNEMTRGLLSVGAGWPSLGSN